MNKCIALGYRDLFKQILENPEQEMLDSGEWFDYYFSEIQRSSLNTRERVQIFFNLSNKFTACIDGKYFDRKEENEYRLGGFLECELMDIESLLERIFEYHGSKEYFGKLIAVFIALESKEQVLRLVTRLLKNNNMVTNVELDAENRLRVHVGQVYTY